MSNLTRRSLLGRAAALSAAARATTATAATCHESAELLALGERIEPLLIEWRTAVERKRECRELAEKLCPVIPEALFRKKGEYGPEFLNTSYRERDVEDRVVYPPDRVLPDGKIVCIAPRHIFGSVELRERLDLFKWSARSKRGNLWRRLIVQAERYETEREAAIEASGLPVAIEEVWHTTSALDQLAFSIREMEPATMHGVMIHARIHTAIEELTRAAVGGVHRPAVAFGDTLAQAILRIAG